MRVNEKCENTIHADILTDSTQINIVVDDKTFHFQSSCRVRSSRMKKKLFSSFFIHIFHHAKLEHFFSYILFDGRSSLSSTTANLTNHLLWTLWKWFFFNLTRRSRCDFFSQLFTFFFCYFHIIMSSSWISIENALIMLN